MHYIVMCTAMCSVKCCGILVKNMPCLAVFYNELSIVLCFSLLYALYCAVFCNVHSVMLCFGLKHVYVL